MRSMTVDHKIFLSHSETLFKEAKRVIPGGVNSPVRAFHGVGGTPIFFERGEGAYLVDVDKKPYIDYVLSWGPLIVGHAHPTVVCLVQEIIAKGLRFGAPTELEIRLAEKICELMKNIEKVRLVNSGTEATMTAIRLARGVTGRNKIVKFEGCYHGHSDSLLVKAGSGALTLGVPSSPGVPTDFTQHTLTATFNDVASVVSLFEKYGRDIAAVMVEPVAGNMGCVLPLPGFLQGLREICNQYQSLLILDEVMTGFRVGLGGAQEYYDVKPDMTTLGKVIGGGMPVGALGGSAAIMDQLAPEGKVYQAGTLSGNPIACAAGLATLQLIDTLEFHQELAAKTERLVVGIRERAKAAGIACVINYVGSMFGCFFTTSEEVSYYQQVVNCNIEQYKRFFHGMLKQGVYFAPSAFESGFLSSAHGDEEIENTLLAVEKVFDTL